MRINDVVDVCHVEQVNIVANLEVSLTSFDDFCEPGGSLPVTWSAEGDIVNTD